MDEQNSGGSTDLSSGLGTAFGFTGGTTTKDEGSTPPVAESSHQEGSELKTQPEKAEELNVPKPEEEKIFKKQAEDNRKLVIDMLEDKFQQVKSGKLSQDELKKWFSTHGEIAETANRSKRVKDRYRELMDTAVETPREIPQETSEVITEEPLTRKELEATLARFNEEQSIKNISRSIVQERETQLEDFAIVHKVLDKNFDSLRRNADALFKANPEMDYSEAVTAAYHAFNPQKSSPVNIPTSQIQAPETLQTEKFDATAPGGIQLISAEEFSRGQLK